jgi:hypothetical protein
MTSSVPNPTLLESAPSANIDNDWNLKPIRHEFQAVTVPVEPRGDGYAFEGSGLEKSTLEDMSNRLAERADKMREHIVAAMRKQNRMNNLNFAAGVASGAIGLWMLATFLPNSAAALDQDGVVAYFFIRLSLVALIETFAFFFLNLYRSGIAEMKRLRDELSTAHSRALALRTAIESRDGASVSYIVRGLGVADHVERSREDSPKSTNGSHRSDEAQKTAQELMKLAGALLGKAR